MDFMRPLKRTFSHFSDSFRRSKIDMSAFILYKIVDSHLTDVEERYKVQCINTKAVLELTLEELMSDLDILYGLHPVQGCFIGIEYAKKVKAQALPMGNSPQTPAKFSGYRYGNNTLLFQKRDGDLGFVCNNNGQEYLMDPRDIALSKELIQEFDVAQAFCIGVLAGFKFVSPVNATPTMKRPALRLVKG